MLGKAKTTGLIRKLVSFSPPPSWAVGTNGEMDSYFISFGYYGKDGRYAGLSREARFTADEFYRIIKPHLKLTRRD